MEMLARLVDGFISFRTGTEGSRHDPYSYAETTVKRKGMEVTVHEGLDYWLKVEGRKVLSSCNDVTKAFVFEQLCGYPPERIPEFIQRANRRCKNCGSRHSHSDPGYLGEELYVCDGCGNITGSSFTGQRWNSI